LTGRLQIDGKFQIGAAGTAFAAIDSMANPKADELKARTKRFATGVAANYRACRSRSDAEFAARVGVVLEEADEAAFWIEVVVEGFPKAPNATELLDEANQLTAIFAASTITERHRSRSGHI
jgi:four helix bundle protein